MVGVLTLQDGSSEARMNRMRFSIASLLVWVALLGVGITALRSASPLWANALFSLAIGTLTVSILAAVYRKGRRRAFWVGFATCGWVYMLLSLGPDSDALASPFLITTAILDLLYPKVVPPPAAAPAGPGMGPGPAAMVQPRRWEVRVFKTGGLVGGWPMTPVPPRSPWAAWTATDRETGSGTTIGGVSFAIPDSFQRIGHSLFCLLAALIGGMITRYLYSTRDVS
jgi:hypothetical protein